ncbi:hypothetical protein VDGE_08720 [Verticillium dahliae]|uniref:Involucrin repeat protein n=1 Tax=Verticillium dahliae TaxID=27337 RepID=A0A444S8D4_VERDA|nr:hypothetical protein VDGE_08720 [Verticillium dahliae]
MMRDSRRRSPTESSRRRRKERRNSRDKIELVSAPSASESATRSMEMPGPMPGSMPEDPAPRVTETSRVPPETSSSRSHPQPPSQSQYPYNYQYHDQAQTPQPQYQSAYQQPLPQQSPYQQQQQQQLPQTYQPQQSSFQQYPQQYQQQYPQNQYSQHHQSPSQYPAHPQAPYYGEPVHSYPNGRARNSDSSSDTSSSLLNVSRRSPKYAKAGNVFTSFFRSPSEQRHRRRQKKKNTRFMSFGANSSSSSLDSDLAYGRGYIPREGGSLASGSRRVSPGPNGKASQYSQGARRTPTAELHRPPLSVRGGKAEQAKTDEEILAIGRQLSDIARKQNEADLRASGKVRPSTLVGAAAALSAFSRSRTKDGSKRGIGSSRPGRDDEDSDWESASDDDDSSSSDDVDPGLVYGSTANLPSSLGAPTSQAAHDGNRNHAVDPSLFGPYNSLRGSVTPIPFAQPSHAYSSPRHQSEEPKADTPSSSSRIGKQPMQHVYAIPTSDPNNFDVDRGSIISSRHTASQSSRPPPVPLQQPIPVAPVSSKVYATEKLADEDRRRELRDERRHTDGGSLAGVAVAGVAAAAIGAAVASSRKDSRDVRDSRDTRDPRDPRDPRESRDSRGTRDSRDYRDYPREDRHQERRLGRNDYPEKTERDDYARADKDRRRRSHRDSNVKVIDERDQTSSRREKDPSYDSQLARRHTAPVDQRDKSYKLPKGDEIRVELDQEKDRRYQDELRRARREEPPATTKEERHRSRPEQQPFQVADDAFATPKHATPTRPLTPQVFTIDREPDFGDSKPRSGPSEDARLSRKDSFEIEQRMELDRKGSRSRSRTPEPRPRHAYEEEEHAARSIYEEAKHATGPVAVAAFASAIAIEQQRSRERHRDDYDDDGSRRRTRADRDVVQEEADRYYRESVIARKIAEDDLRSRSASPHDKSIVDKWQEDKEPATKEIAIVTPPEMDHPHDKSPYDAPNADVRIDHVIKPNELSRFRVPADELYVDTATVWKSRDPSCERDRPLLNLVLPTPHVTPSPTPNPETQSRAAPREAAKQQSQSTEPRSAPPDIIIGPRGEIIQTPSTPKSVTWGENETKRFEVESPEPPEKKGGSRISTTTGWGVVAAAVAGSVAASSDDKPSRNGEDRGRGCDDSSRSRTYEAVDARPSWDDTDAPPIPGPKPRSPSPSGRNPTMPGGFGDDAEFTSIMAAGLQDSGFDPKIVTQNPAYSRKSWDDSSKPRSDVGTKGQSSWDDKDASWVSETKKTRSSSAGPRRARPSGGYGDDVEFASVLAAGLQDTGFDPNIVIDDPTYRRRDSPPGSNEPGLYHRPYAETVSDLGVVADAIPCGPLPESGIVLGELTETPVQETAPAVDGWDTPSKLSKKDKKKRDKASKRQSTDTFDEPLPASEPAPADDLSRDIVPESISEPVAEQEDLSKLSKKERKKREKALAKEVVIVQDDVPSPAPETDLPATQPADVTAEDEWAAPSSSSKKKKKKGKKSTDTPDETEDQRVAVPVDAFQDLQSTTREAEPVLDEFDTPKKSKKKSKRDSLIYDSPSGAVSEVSVGGTRTKKYHKRDSTVYDSPSAAVSEVSVGGTRSKRSSKQNSLYDSPSAAVSEVSIGGTRSKKDKRKSVDYSLADDYADDKPGDPPDSGGRSFIDDRDVTSVVSDPASKYDRHERRSNGTRYDDGDDTRSIASFASAPDGRKRSSKDGKRKEPEKKSSGFFGLFNRSSTEVNKKSDSRKDEQSFLDNAGTLGAGVGLAGAAAYVASRRNAAGAFSSEDVDPKDRPTGSTSRDVDYVDPEIVHRTIKPAIDPQYGDLLPLPPSEPGSPRKDESDEELPALPESRPETPPEERNKLRQKPSHTRRRSAVDAPSKSPSRTAIPIQLRMGQRSNPSSPAYHKSSPVASPIATPVPEPTTPRRPTSWDNSREIKPLYLLEHARQGQMDPDVDLPELPPSEASSRESPSPFAQTDDDLAAWDVLYPEEHGLRLDTDIPEALPKDRAGSQESTPKATRRGLDAETIYPLALDDAPLPSSQAKSLDSMVSQDDLIDLPPLPSNPSGPDSEQEPGPVEPMSKDRSSYLLHSTPPSLRDIAERDWSRMSPDQSPSRDAAVGLQDGEKKRSSGLWGAAAGVAAGGLAALGLFGSSDKKGETPATEDDRKDETAEVQDEWASTPSKKKKGKKGKKAKEEIAEDVSTPVPEDLPTPVPEVLSAPVSEPDTVPAQSADDVAETKASKKSKKKGKKNASSEPEPESAAPLEIVEETPRAVPEELPNSEPLVEDVVAIDPSDAIPEAAAPATEDVLDEPKSAKKKKKKGKKSQALDSELQTPTEVVDESARAILHDTPAAEIPAAETISAEPPLGNAAVAEVTPEAAITEAIIPVVEELVEEPKSSKKSKKKSKKAQTPEPEPIVETAVVDDAPEPTPDESLAADPLVANVIRDAAPQTADDTLEEPKSAKKGKKKGKKTQGLEPESEQPFEDNTKAISDETPLDEFVEPTAQPVLETQPEPMSTAEIAPDTFAPPPGDSFEEPKSTKKSKKKGTKSQSSSWDVDEPQVAAAEETYKALPDEPLAEIVETPDEPTTPAPEDAPEEPKSSKKSKKKGKKGLSLDADLPVEPVADIPQISSQDVVAAEPSTGDALTEPSTPLAGDALDDETKSSKKSKKKGKEMPAWDDDWAADAGEQSTDQAPAEEVSAEAPIATGVEPEPPSVEAFEDAPVPAKLSKKDKKKAKKNQGADLDWAEATDDSIVKAEEPVVEDSITAAALPEVSVAEPIGELPEPAKLSKKDKKKAKKNQSWESDWTTDTPQESTATAADVEAPVAQVEGETLDLGLETPLDSTTAFDEPDAGSKKGKKKKKGKKATSLDEEATPTVTTEPIPEAFLADEPAIQIQGDNVSTGSITPTGLSASYKQDEAMLAWEDALDDHSAIKSPPQAAQGLGNELRQADDPAPDDASDIFFDAEDEARALSRAATPANADFNAQAILNETTPEAKPPAPDPWADETFFLPPKKSKIKEPSFYG